MNAQDQYGNTALHLACEKGKLDMAKFLFDKHARDDIFNGEGHTAFHSAVNGGNEDIIDLCLNYFWNPISTTQSFARFEFNTYSTRGFGAHRHTIFHLACRQSTEKIVKLLLESHLEKYPNDGLEALKWQDVDREMTPLHEATISNRPGVIKYLIEKGSQLDTVDSDNRSPLLLSATCGETQSMDILLQAGAKVTIQDRNDRNILHYLVIYGHPIEKLRRICSMTDGKTLLNQKDLVGCTPLHFASKRGKIPYIRSFLELKADVNPKDRNQQTPLHFAAKYVSLKLFRHGQIGALRILSDYHGLNEQDRYGQTALHLASIHGYYDVVEELLHKGAIFHSDFFGQTPLHVASKSGHIETVKRLLSSHGVYKSLDGEDKNGHTALECAALGNQAEAVKLLMTAGADILKLATATIADRDQMVQSPIALCCHNGFVETAIAMIQHERCDEIMQHHLKRMDKLTFSEDFRKEDYKQWCTAESERTGIPNSPPFALIKCLPEVYKILLGRNHHKIGQNPHDESYKETFVFKDKNTDLSLEALNCMVEHDRVELLSHPLCLQFLQMKWKAVGVPMFILNTYFYLLFLVSLTYLIISQNPNGYLQRMNINETGLRNDTFTKISSTWNIWVVICIGFLSIFLFGNFIKEIVELVQQGKYYFFDPFNYIEWLVYLSSSAFVFPTYGFAQNNSFQIQLWQWQFGAVAVFLAWINLMLYFARAHSIGIYILMFLEILKTLIRVVFIFSILFFAFALGFQALLFNYAPFKNSLISLINTLMMVMGEVNFVDTYIVGNLHFPILSYIFLVVFIAFMPLLFINLLIGLSVGDVGAIQKNAELKRFELQVEYLTSIEKRLFRCFLVCFGVNSNKQKVEIKPNVSYFNNRLVSWVVCKIGELVGISDQETLQAAVKYEVIEPSGPRDTQTIIGNRSESEEHATTKQKYRLTQKSLTHKDTFTFLKVVGFG